MMKCSLRPISFFIADFIPFLNSAKYMPLKPFILPFLSGVCLLCTYFLVEQNFNSFIIATDLRDSMMIGFSDAPLRCQSYLLYIFIFSINDFDYKAISL